VLANYSLEQSAVQTSPQLSYLHDVFESMMKLASALCEPLQNSIRNCRALLDSSTVSEQEFNQLLAYLLLLEQIALNKQEWEFSQAGQSKLSVILSDIEIDLSPSKKLFKLGYKSQYLEKKQAHHALLSGLQHGLVVLENKLDSVLIVGLIDNEEKIIRNVLGEIISVLKFLNAEKLIQDFSSLKDSVIQYIEQASEDLTLADTIVEKKATHRRTASPSKTRAVISYFKSLIKSCTFALNCQPCLTKNLSQRSTAVGCATQ